MYFHITPKVNIYFEGNSLILVSLVKFTQEVFMADLLRAKIFKKISLSNINPEHLEFLKIVKKIKDPKKLVFELQRHSNKFNMNRQEIIQLLGKAKEEGIFKEHFLIPNMERAWRFWVKENGGASLAFKFES